MATAHATTVEAPTKRRAQLLLNKHSPRTLRDVLMPEMLLRRLCNIASAEMMANMLLHGKQGVGKTTIANLLLQHLAPPADSVLRLSGSDSFTEGTVARIGTFCRRVQEARTVRVVFIDDADNIPARTQTLLANAMDELGKACRFIITARNLEDMSELIQSRCGIFGLPPLGRKDVVGRLKEVCAAEGIGFTSRALDLIALTAQGDLRRAVNMLDVIAMTTRHIDEDAVMRFSHLPPSIVINRLVQACIDMDLDRAVGGVESLCDQGYSAHDIVQSLIHCMTLTDFDAEVKHAFLCHAHETYSLINHVEYDKLQLLACIARMIKAAKELVHS